MQSLLPNMRLMRRISFLSRPNSLLNRRCPLQQRCHLSSSAVILKEPPKGFGNFGQKTPEKGSKKRKRRESRKEATADTGKYSIILHSSDLRIIVMMSHWILMIFGENSEFFDWKKFLKKNYSFFWWKNSDEKFSYEKNWILMNF